LLTEPFEAYVLVQVDLVAPAPVTPDDELATAPLIEQLPEVVKLPEPPLAEKLHVLAFATCVIESFGITASITPNANSRQKKIGFVHLRKTGYSSLWALLS